MPERLHKFFLLMILSLFRSTLFYRSFDFALIFENIAFSMWICIFQASILSKLFTVFISINLLNFERARLAGCFNLSLFEPLNVLLLLILGLDILGSLLIQRILLQHVFILNLILFREFAFSFFLEAIVGFRLWVVDGVGSVSFEQFVVLIGVAFGVKLLPVHLV